MRIQSWRRLCAGLLVVAFGLAGVYFASGLKFGTAAAMGPGFLPTVCSWLIVVLGGIMLTMALHDDVEVIEAPVPRPVAMIFLSIGLFAVLIDRAGLAIAVFATAFTASYAGQARLGETLALSIAAALASVVIFVVMLRLPMRVWPELG